MARLSTSPSGSSRRLSELLEEQQEPFSLDLYLLDKGYSPMLLDAAGSSGSATSACWPKRRGTSSAPQRRMVVPSKRTPVGGLLRLLLPKILHGAATAVAKKKKKLPPAAMGRSPVDAVLFPPQRVVEAGRNEADEEEEDAGDVDNESSKQLSPVSVLEQSTFEQAPKAYAQTIAGAAVIFRELMEAAYKPALVDDLANDSSDNKSKHGRNETSTMVPEPAPAPTTRTDRTTGAAAHWEEIFEAELAKVHDLVASDMAGAKVWPGDVRPEQQGDVGCDVAVAVLEALTEEIAVELMGMDHDDAMDNGGRSGCR